MRLYYQRGGVDSYDSLLKRVIIFGSIVYLCAFIVLTKSQLFSTGGSLRMFGFGASFMLAAPMLSIPWYFLVLRRVGNGLVRYLLNYGLYIGMFALLKWLFVPELPVFVLQFRAVDLWALAAYAIFAGCLWFACGYLARLSTRPTGGDDVLVWPRNLFSRGRNSVDSGPMW